MLVSPPKSYHGDTSARFPAIYLIDASRVFGPTAQAHYLLRLGGMVPDALIVGTVKGRVEEDVREGTSGARYRIQVGQANCPRSRRTREVGRQARARKPSKTVARQGMGPFVGNSARIRRLCREASKPQR